MKHIFADRALCSEKCSQVSSLQPITELPPAVPKMSAPKGSTPHFPEMLEKLKTASTREQR